MKIKTLLSAILLVLLSANLKSQSIDSLWYKEGIIYETHPYYYPNHSFNEITQQIPSLADLGVKTIWMMPIWEHKAGTTPTAFIYLINDYYKIDTAAYGTENDLKELVDTAHSYNMKVLFDLVTCCTPQGSVLWNNNLTFKIPLSTLQSMGLSLSYGTYQGDSIVYSNCNFSATPVHCDLLGQIVGTDVIIYHYPNAGWGPAVDRIKPEVVDSFTNIAEYYVQQYGIDGWRMDSPVDNWNPNIISGNHSIVTLMSSVKQGITTIKPSAILYSESPYEANISPQIPYPTEIPVFDEIANMSNSNLIYLLDTLKSSDSLVHFFNNENILYNRDRVRFMETNNIQRINKRAPLLNKPLIVLTSTVPGIPLIQAGQEIGDTNQLFSNNPTVDWSNGDYQLRDFYKKVFKIRNNSPALKYGTIDNVWKAGDTTYAYIRSQLNENIVVVINFSASTTTSYLDLSVFNNGAILYDLLSTNSYSIYDSSNFQISIPPYSARILSTDSILNSVTMEPYHQPYCKIYPNPTTGRLTIEMKNVLWQNKEAVIEISNVNGERLYQTIIRNSKSEININLSNGIYFYQVIDNKQIISSGKLVIKK